MQAILSATFAVVVVLPEREGCNIYYLVERLYKTLLYTEGFFI